VYIYQEAKTLVGEQSGVTQFRTERHSLCSLPDYKPLHEESENEDHRHKNYLNFHVFQMDVPVANVLALYDGMGAE
jgi:hypothetical protein